jgi:hypothetical protein
VQARRAGVRHPDPSVDAARAAPFEAADAAIEWIASQGAGFDSRMASTVV